MKIELSGKQTPAKAPAKALEFGCLEAPPMSARFSARVGRISARVGPFDFGSSALSSSRFDSGRQTTSSRSLSSRSTASNKSWLAESLGSGLSVGSSTKKASKWSQYSVASRTVVVAQDSIKVVADEEFILIASYAENMCLSAPGRLDGQRRRRH